MTGGARDPPCERPSLRQGRTGAESCSRTWRPRPSPRDRTPPGPGRDETRRASPGCPEPTPARPSACPPARPPAALPFRSVRPARARPGLRRVPPLGRVSGGCRRASALRRVSGRCRRGSASRLVSGGVGGARPLRRVSAALQRVGGDSGRRLPQEAGPAPPPPRRSFSQAGRQAFLSLRKRIPPRRVSRARRRGRRQEEGRWGWVQTKEPGRRALSAEGMAMPQRRRRLPGGRDQPKPVSRRQGPRA